MLTGSSALVVLSWTTGEHLVGHPNTVWGVNAQPDGSINVTGGGCDRVSFAWLWAQDAHGSWEVRAKREWKEA